MSTGFLAFLALPFVAIALGVWALRPQLLDLQGSSLKLVLLALVAAPVAVGLELLVHGAVTYRTTGRRPGGVTLDRFWGNGLSITDYLLLAAVVVGEELIYRQIWIVVLMDSFALPMLAALAVSSVLYGLNHMAFGPTSVVSKTLAGLIFGGLFLASGSLWPPLLAHALSNVLIFGAAGRGGS